MSSINIDINNENTSSEESSLGVNIRVIPGNEATASPSSESESSKDSNESQRTCITRADGHGQTLCLFHCLPDSSSLARGKPLLGQLLLCPQTDQTSCVYTSEAGPINRWRAPRCCSRLSPWRTKIRAFAFSAYHQACSCYNSPPPVTPRQSERRPDPCCREPQHLPILHPERSASKQGLYDGRMPGLASLEAKMEAMLGPNVNVVVVAKTPRMECQRRCSRASTRPLNVACLTTTSMHLGQRARKNLSKSYSPTSRWKVTMARVPESRAIRHGSLSCMPMMWWQPLNKSEAAHPPSARRQPMHFLTSTMDKCHRRRNMSA